MSNISKRQYGGLDWAKLVAAFFVVAIHTSPLASFSLEADFVLTRILARLAVPFFLMVTGFFVLPRYLFTDNTDSKPLFKSIKKLVILYAIALILYLPVGIYAGHYEGLNPFTLLTTILFEGTFYHLWYLPATILGLLVIYGLSRKLGPKLVVVIVALLYLIGLGGDSYFKVTSGIPGLSAFYDSYFQAFSYTRNGLFYAPLFLLLGAYMSKWQNRVSRPASSAGLLLSMIALFVEAERLHQAGLQRHDSMYITLVAAAAFLFLLLVSFNVAPSEKARSLSTWIYILHPLCIILVRGIAKVLGMSAFIIGNSLVFFVSVCVLTTLISLIGYEVNARVVKPFFRCRQQNRADAHPEVRGKHAR